MENSQVAAMASKIVGAYIANNRASTEEVVSLLSSVGMALSTAANPAPVAMAEPSRKRQIVRRRGGKVVESGGGGEDATNDETASDDDAFNEHGHPKRPEPMFD